MARSKPTSTLEIRTDLKEALRKRKIIEREPYNDVIKRLLEMEESKR